MIAIQTQIRLYSSALLSCVPDYSITWMTRLCPAPKSHSERALTLRQTQEDLGFRRGNTFSGFCSMCHRLFQRILGITHSFNVDRVCSVPLSTHTDGGNFLLFLG